MIRDNDGITPTAFRAAGCFCLYDDQVLLIQHQQGKPFAMHWAIPTGKIEAGETPVQCMMRELREELSLEARPELLAPISDSLVDHEATTFQYVSFALVLQSPPRLTPKQDEIRRVQWRPVEKILKRRAVPFFYNTLQDLRAWQRSGTVPPRLGPRPEARSGRIQPSMAG